MPHYICIYFSSLSFHAVCSCQTLRTGVHPQQNISDFISPRQPEEEKREGRAAGRREERGADAGGAGCGGRSCAIRKAVCGVFLDAPRARPRTRPRARLRTRPWTDGVCRNFAFVPACHVSARSRGREGVNAIILQLRTIRTADDTHHFICLKDTTYVTMARSETGHTAGTRMDVEMYRRLDIQT